MIFSLNITFYNNMISFICLLLLFKFTQLIVISNIQYSTQSEGTTDPFYNYSSYCFDNTKHVHFTKLCSQIHNIIFFCI